MQASKGLSKKFAALSKREKVIILLSGLVSILFISFTFIIEPEMKKQKAKSNRLKNITAQVKEMREDKKLLELQLQADPDAEVEKKLLRLVDEREDVVLQLSEFVKNLTSPSEMAELLETVLNNSTALKLESLQSLHPYPVRSNDNSSIHYYIHPVRLVLTGKYFDIQKYLLTLESMEVKYFWHSFHYQVVEYPKARLELVVYTLGTEQEFIGG